MNDINEIEIKTNTYQLTIGSSWFVQTEETSSQDDYLDFKLNCDEKSYQQHTTDCPKNTVREFIQTLKTQSAPLTKFDESLWNLLTQSVTV